MRIAIIPSWYDSPSAPARGSFIKAQAEGLSARGHDILMIIPDRDGSGRLLSLTKGTENGIRCIRISVPTPWHRLFGFYLPKVFASIISKEIKEFAPNLVHAHAVRPAGILAFHALRESSIPYVLTEHSGPLEKFWWTAHGKRQIAIAYQNASRLFAVSDFLRQDMLKHFGNAANSASVLFNGVHMDSFALGRQPPMKGSFLFVGSLEKEKGLHVLLNALGSLPKELSWTLTVVGIGAEEGNLRKQAGKLELFEKIVWLGTQKHRDMPDIYASHDYVVVPSLHETFSMVCAEALASARPVIAALSGGPEEVVPRFGGKLIPANDVEALSECLVEALRGLLYFDAERAVQHIREKFSMEGLLTNLENAYASLFRSGD